MSQYSNIQWCDSTANSTMGCGSLCELWPTILKLINIILHALGVDLMTPAELRAAQVRDLLEGMEPSDVYHARRRIAIQVVGITAGERDSFTQKQLRKTVEKAIAAPFVCYAGYLHLRHGKDDNKPDKKTNKGYAPKFEQITKFAGRLRASAQWSDLTGTARPDKPWLDGLPRLIFVSDMGDLLSPEIDFEYIKIELIDNAASPEGQRHIWLWLTKQPRRMAEFSRWLKTQGVTWPGNLVAMTSVTSEKTVWRVRELAKVECEHRGLSVEPLSTPVTLPLEGIDWVIVGGESGHYAAPFDLVWAWDIREQCRRAGVAFFLKQFGARPMENGALFKLADKHGGTWEEWPAGLQVREMPPAFARCCHKRTSALTQTL